MGPMSSILAALYDPIMRRTEEACLREWRAELLRDLRGAVLEIGAGTGANVPHYPRTLDRLVLTEPDPAMLKRLRRHALPPGAETLEADVSALPFEAGSFDVVVGTLVLCSVGSQESAISEIARVLKPGGAFVFLEHVAGHGARLRWQRRIEPFWCRLAGHCHLTRDTEAAIGRRFALAPVARESMRKALPMIRPTIRGVAHLPS